MPNKTLWPTTRRVKGFTPALDRRQLVEPSVVAGQNFLIDAEGPYSAFGNRIPTYAQIEDSEHAASFRIENELFIFTTNGVLAYDSVSDQFYVVLVFATPSSDIFPWSHAVVGGKHYFAKKGHDLIQYTPSTQTWAEITTDVPTGLVQVTSSGDRLILLGSSFVARSAISDGTDLATSSVTGAGAQALALIGGGTPLGVRRTSTGYIVFTTEGTMVATQIDATVPFRHRNLGEDYIPISPYAIIEIEQNIIFLSQQGLRQTNGQLSQPFDELMSEYLRRELLPNIDFDVDGVIKLTYSREKQWMVIHVSESEVAFNFNIAYVMYLPVQQWGIFNRLHRNFLEILIDSGIDEGYNFGFIDDQDIFHKFTDDPFAETGPSDFTSLEYYRESLATVTRYENDVLIASSGMRVYDLFFEDFLDGSGLYDFNNPRYYFDISTADDENSEAGTPYVARSTMRMGTGLVHYVPQQWERIQSTLDSFIYVGPYRMSEKQLADEISLVTQVMIGTDELGVQVDTEDYNAVSPTITEDWLNDDLIDEDWGEGILSGTDFDAYLLGTIDGEHAFNYEEEELMEYFQAELTRFYPAHREGIYHLIALKAQSEGQSFHLKLQELSGMIVGNL